MAHKWPAMRGLEQYDYEPPRVVYGSQKGRRERLQALGNAIVPEQVAPIFSAIYEHIEAAKQEVA